MDERSQRIQQRFELPMAVAALLVIPLLAIEQSDPEGGWEIAAVVLNWGTWLAFVIEFVVMMLIVPNRWEWIRRNPLDVVVVFLTPPFLPASLATARLFRLLRLLRLLRVIPAFRRLLSAEGVKYASLLAAVTVIAGGTAFAAIEVDQNLSSWDGIWWAVTTVTTVGYGDISPETEVGRVLAVLIMFVGIGFVALLTAFVADRFIRQDALDQVESEQDQILRRLEALDSRLERMEGMLRGRR